MTTSNWLVLGLGNRLPGADGFGPAVIDALKAGGDLPGVELLDVDTDLLGHLHRFAGRDEVILLDAVLDDDASGVAIIDEATFSTWETRSTGAHGMSAVMAVRLFRTLQSDGPRITLVAYRVSEAEFLRPLDDSQIREGAEAVRRLFGRFTSLA